MACNRLVAGSGWHNFTLSAANHSDQDLGQVQWLATVDNYADSDDEGDWLSTYAQLEYFNPTTKSWESIADEVGNGIYFGETTLGGKQTVAIKLRVNIGSKAPAGEDDRPGAGGVDVGDVAGWLLRLRRIWRTIEAKVRATEQFWCNDATQRLSVAGSVVSSLPERPQFCDTIQATTANAVTSEAAMMIANASSLIQSQITAYRLLFVAHVCFSR